MKKCPFSQHDCIEEQCAIYLKGYDGKGNECAIVETVMRLDEIIDKQQQISRVG